MCARCMSPKRTLKYGELINRIRNHSELGPNKSKAWLIKGPKTAGHKTLVNRRRDICLAPPRLPATAHNKAGNKTTHHPARQRQSNTEGA